MTLAYDAVLLTSFGGPEGPEDILPFLRNVTAGRGIPDERLIAVSGHYRTLGGVSPINEQNRRLRAQVEAELAARGLDLPVLWGNRNWHPMLGDVVEQADRDGRRRLLALVTSAYSGYSSCRQYREDFAAALAVGDLAQRVTIDKIRPYFDHPGFLLPFADGVATGVAELRDGAAPGLGTPASPAAGPIPLDRIEVLFTTHSIPTAAAAAAGPEAAGGDYYLRQHRAVVAEVVRRAAASLGVEPTALNHRLCFQSRSGAPHIPWLEPDIGDVIEDLADAGRAAVLVVPIGFITDHVEVHWDLDVVAREVADKREVVYRRVPTPGSDPRFVTGLADLIVERLDPSRPREHLTDLGPMPDVCAVRCCLPTGARRPTVAGLDSADDSLAAAPAERPAGPHAAAPAERPAARPEVST